MRVDVLLVDDHVILRRGLAQLLQAVEHVAIVGECSTGSEALKMIPERRPNVVVLDLALPDIEGVELTRQIVASGSGVKVLALSGFSDRRHVFDVMRAGASGYVVKDCDLQELAQAIHAVAAGERYLSPAVASMLLNSLAESTHDGNGTRLTIRESEVLRLLATGKAMKQVAVDLQISTKTVETHRRAIMEKLQLFSIAELTKYAIREGLASIE